MARIEDAPAPKYIVAYETGSHDWADRGFKLFVTKESAATEYELQAQNGAAVYFAAIEHCSEYM